MKIGQVITILFAILLGVSMFSMGVQAEEAISYTDPEGDVFDFGAGEAAINNIDLLSLNIDFSSDPVVITTTVAGVFVFEGESTNMYSYLIHIDQTGDDESNTDISISNTFPHILDTEFSDTGGTTLMVDGNNTSTLTVSFSREDIGLDSNPVSDVFIESAVVDTVALGTASDDVNYEFIQGSKSDDDDDDDDTNDDMIPDPLKETPTDTSIGVSIGDLKFYADKGDDSFEMETSVDGNTEGDVHHCSFTMVTYYKDGTYEAQDWTVGPEDQPRDSILGMTFEMYFKGKGSNGDDDWSEWSIYLFASGPATFYDEMMGAPIDDEDDTEDIESVYYVVRAYSDEEETMWNQDSKEIKEEITDFWLGKSSSDDNGLPAPGIIFFVGSILIVASAAIIGKGRKRN